MIYFQSLKEIASTFLILCFFSPIYLGFLLLEESAYAKKENECTLIEK